MKTGWIPEYFRYLLDKECLDSYTERETSYVLEATGSGMRLALRVGNVVFSDIMQEPTEGELVVSAELLAQRAGRFARRLAHFRSLRASFDETGEVGHGCPTHGPTPLRKQPN